MARICVLGGTGFIGRHVLNRLVARGDKAVVPTRRLSHARDLYLLPTVEFVHADIHDDATLARLLAGCDAVVNLVGILHGRPAGSGEPYGRDFAQAHVELPRRLVAAAANSRIEHIVHLSALNAAPDAPSEYLRSKGEGEAALQAAPERVQTTVFRPSVVFGREDRMLNLFAQLQRVLPVLFLACPDARFQPAYVEDVAECVARAVLNPDAYARSYALCGPRVYSLRELVDYTGRVTGHHRPIVGLSPSLSELQARMMEWLPIKLLTRDNVRSMKLDSVCNEPLPFGIPATGLEAVAPAWLAGGPRMRIFAYRTRAGR